MASTSVLEVEIPSGFEAQLATTTTTTTIATEETISSPHLIDLHFIPCSIAYSGPADLKRWFNPQNPVEYYDDIASDGGLVKKTGFGSGSKSLMENWTENGYQDHHHEPIEARFRGHLLTGHRHPLPNGTVGVIIELSPTQYHIQPENYSVATMATETPSPQQTLATSSLSSSSSSSSLTTAMATTTPITDPIEVATIVTPIGEANHQTNGVLRLIKRSKQDDLFDAYDDDFGLAPPPQVGSSQSFPFSQTLVQSLLPTLHGNNNHDNNNNNNNNSIAASTTTTIPTTTTANDHNDNDDENFDLSQQSIQTETVNNSGPTKLRLKQHFHEIVLWDPQHIEDSSFFSFRQQPIDELIPLSQALHLGGYDDDSE